MTTHGQLHAAILQHIIEHGVAPKVAALSERFGVPEERMIAALHALAEYHGVVLHPHTPEVWVIHPFSLAPTNFLVRAAVGGAAVGGAAVGEWWGNCAWCSLGAAALLNRDVTITTTLGADRRQVDLHIRDGQVVETDFVVHFPIPMSQAWDNVIYTCSTMLLFEDAAHVDAWCRRHGIAKGDIQPIANVWAFARVWYGNHLNPEWTKWTTDEARAIFERFGLTSAIWQLPESKTRF